MLPSRTSCLAYILKRNSSVDNHSFKYFIYSSFVGQQIYGLFCVTILSLILIVTILEFPFDLIKEVLH